MYSLICARVKWLKIVIFVVMLLVTVGGEPRLEAEASPGLYSYVTVTFTSTTGVLPPASFTATYIDQNRVDAAWTSPDPTYTTIIRAKIGDYPTSPTDGYSVYTGGGTSVTDNGVNLDLTLDDIYYAAYSYDGLTYSAPSLAKVGNVMMWLGIMFVTALILTYLSTRSAWIFCLFASAMWFALMAYWGAGNRPTAITAGSPTDQIIMYIFIGMGLACLGMLFWREYGNGGKSRNGGRFQWPGRQSEEEEANQRHSPDRQERNDDYTERVSRASRGEITHRRY